MLTNDCNLINIENMKALEENLINILNLRRYEARVYIALLSLGQASPTDIARYTHISRTAIYSPLQSLLRKTLISAMQVKKRKYYQAIDLKQLQFILDKKKIDLAEIISRLSKTISASRDKLFINYYEGAGGITLASDIFLEETKEELWKTFEQPIYTAQAEGTWQVDEYVNKRVAKNIFARVITPNILNSEWLKEKLAHDKEELRETILVSPETYSIEATIAVTKGMILLISAKKQRFAILIKNDELAETISAVHDMVWDRYKT